MKTQTVIKNHIEWKFEELRSACESAITQLPCCHSSISDYIFRRTA